MKCVNAVKDAAGKVVEVHCTYDPATRGGDAPDGRKVQGTIHWVSAEHAAQVEVRLYDHLFNRPEPEEAPEGKTFLDNMNPNSLEIITCPVEPSLVTAATGSRFQFERLGYFFVDPVDSQPGKPVFNRTVTLRDSWAKIEKKGPGKK